MPARAGEAQIADSAFTFFADPPFMISVRLRHLLGAAALVAVGACASSGPSATPSTPADPAPEPAPSAQAGAPAADGLYTSDQAAAGGEVWDASCADCHDRSEMYGSDFMFEWEGSSVGRLYRVVSRTMPDDEPGSLGTEAYLAVVAYILEMNDLPAGSSPLVADDDVLDALRIER